MYGPCDDVARISLHKYRYKVCPTPATRLLNGSGNDAFFPHCKQVGSASSRHVHANTAQLKEQLEQGIMQSSGPPILDKSWG
jgi:hypothetical protein